MWKKASQTLTEGKKLLSLALPLMLVQVAQIGMGVCDTFFLQTLSPDEIGGASLAIQGHSLIGLGLAGTLSAIGVIWVATEQEKHRSTACASCLLYLMMVTCFTLALLTLPSLMPYKLSLHAREYLSPLFYSIPAYLFCSGARHYLAATDQLKQLSKIYLFALLINGIADYMLIGPFRVAGLAWATTIASLYCAVHIGLIHTWPKLKIRGSLHDFARLVKLGAPIGLAQLADGAMIGLAGFLIAHTTPSVLPFHHLMIQWTLLSFLFPSALSVALQLRVRKGSPLAARAGLRIGGGICALMTLIILCLIPNRCQLCYIVALFQLTNAIQILLLGILRGKEDTTLPFILLSLCYYGVGLPISYALCQTPTGVWFGMLIGQFLLCIALAMRAKQATRPVIA